MNLNTCTDIIPYVPFSEVIQPKNNEIFSNTINKTEEVLLSNVIKNSMRNICGENLRKFGDFINTDITEIKDLEKAYAKSMELCYKVEEKPPSMFSRLKSMASTTLSASKEVFLSGYIDTAYDAKDYAVDKLYKLGEFATGINNLKDAYDSMANNERIVKINDNGKLKTEIETVPFLQRAREATGNAIIAPVKWATWFGVATNDTMYNMATGALNLGYSTAVMVAKTATPYVSAIAGEMVKNPVPVAGTVFMGNMLLSAKKNLDKASESESTAEKVVNYGKALGKGALIGATAFGLVSFYG